jgi:hypothetical protein
MSNATRQIPEKRQVPGQRVDTAGHRARHPETGTRARRRKLRERLQRRAGSRATMSTRVSLYRGAVIMRPRSFSGTWRNPSIYLTLLVLSTRRDEAPGVPEAPRSTWFTHLSDTRGHTRAHTGTRDPATVRTCRGGRSLRRRGRRPRHKDPDAARDDLTRVHVPGGDHHLPLLLLVELRAIRRLGVIAMTAQHPETETAGTEDPNHASPVVQLIFLLQPMVAQKRGVPNELRLTDQSTFFFGFLLAREPPRSFIPVTREKTRN